MCDRKKLKELMLDTWLKFWRLFMYTSHDDVYINSTGKTWLYFTLSLVYQISWTSGYGSGFQISGLIDRYLFGKTMSFNVHIKVI